MIENNYVKFWIENEILYCIYKSNYEIDIEGAKQIVKDRLICQNNIKYPAFADFKGVKSVSKEARDYLAKEGSFLVKACAILVSSPVDKIMINFYSKINKPIIPTKLFTNNEDALKWLQQFK